MSQPAEVIDAWPHCPNCHAARNAECVICGTTRDFFPAAYQQEGELHGLKFCIGCDDVAELKYFRRCHQCGHDYGDGYEPPVELPPEPGNSSVTWLVLAGLVVGSGLLAAYFAWLLRR